MKQIFDRKFYFHNNTIAVLYKMFEANSEYFKLLLDAVSKDDQEMQYLVQNLESKENEAKSALREITS